MKKVKKAKKHCFSRRRTDWLRDLLGPARDENMGPLFKEYEEFRDSGHGALNQGRGPAQQGTWCSYPAHVLRKPALDGSIWWQLL